MHNNQPKLKQHKYTPNTPLSTLYTQTQTQTSNKRVTKLNNHHNTRTIIITQHYQPIQSKSQTNKTNICEQSNKQTKINKQPIPAQTIHNQSNTKQSRAVTHKHTVNAQPNKPTNRNNQTN